MICGTRTKRKAGEIRNGAEVDANDIGLPPGWAVRHTLLGEYEYHSEYATTRSFASMVNNMELKGAWSSYLKRLQVVEDVVKESGGRGDFGGLPPGWKLTVNSSGYFEYASDYASTRSFTKTHSKSAIAQAWRRHRHHTQVAESAPIVDSVSRVDAGACLDGSGSFGSLSKTLHRMRVVEHLRLEWCHGIVAPSVAYIGAPDKADSVVFQGFVDDGTLPTETMFYAINHGTFSESAYQSEFPNVVFHENTSMQDFIEIGNNGVYTMIWLDFTSTMVDYYTLWKACQLARTHVMLVLSLRTQSMSNVTRVVDAISKSIGVSLTHIENYRGLSNVRNMAFFEIECSERNTKTYKEQHENVGKLAYISTTAGHEKMFRLERAGVYMHMCFCTGYSPSSDNYTMVPYDSSRHLMAYSTRISVAPEHVLYRAPLNARFESGVCL